MRSTGLLAVAAVLVLCGCGGSSGGSGSGGPPPAGDGGVTTNPPPGDGGVTTNPPPGDGGVTTNPPPGDGGVTTNPPPGDGGVTTNPPPGDGGTVVVNPPDGGTSPDCDGILPATVGAPVTADMGANGTCSDATSDESGNVAAESHVASDQGDWLIFSARGTRTGSVSAISGDLFPQGRGFEGVRLAETPAGPRVPQFVRIAADGSTSHEAFLGNDETAAIAFRAWPDGLLAVMPHCSQPPGTIELRRFRDDGSEIPRATDVSSSEGCGFRAAANDPSGASLLAMGGGAVGTSFLFRWVNPDGTPMSNFFGFGGLVPDKVLLRVLVDGRIAVQADGHWMGVIAAEGGTTMTPPPAWMKDGHDFGIVRGERAYAVIPRTGALNHLDLVSTKGTLCGTVTFPGVSGLTTGADGTVIGASGANGCTKKWWSGLLK